MKTPRFVHPSPMTTALLAALACLTSCGGGGGGGGNSAAVTPGAGTGQGAELVPLAVDLSISALTAGESLIVTDTVENRGDESATGFQVGIYLSQDALVDLTDTLLGFRTIGILSPGLSSTGGGSLTVPLATPAGNYSIGVIADDLNSVSEPNESNNVLLATETLAVTAADLPEFSVTAVSFTPLVLEAGENLEVTDTVINNGVIGGSGVVVGIYLSADATITSADVLLGFRSLGSLDPGQSSMAVGSLAVPPNLFAGAYFVGVIVDDGDAHVESNETNNTLSASFKLQVNAPPRPDLTPSGLSFGPGSVEAGQSIQVSDAILNQGIADSGQFRIGIYLSEDSVVTTDDRLIAVRILPGLAQGISSTVTGVTANIPIETPGGEWFVGIVVDDLEAVVELDEGNNGLAAVGTLTVTVPPTPDLAVSAFSFTPTSVMPALDDQITVTDTVRNQGVIAASQFRIGYYLSSNPVISSGDIFLGSRLVSVLAVGNSSSSSSVLNLPTGLGPGSYFLGAIANDENALLEVFIKNNLFTAPIPLDVISAPIPMPQLSAESISFSPSTVGPGNEIQVEDTVRNLGTVSATSFKVGIYLSLDEVIETDDILIGERFVSSLPINFGSAASAPYKVPIGTPPGVYKVGVLYDNALEIAESDEDDNALAAKGNLTVN